MSKEEIDSYKLQVKTTLTQCTVCKKLVSNMSKHTNTEKCKKIRQDKTGQDIQEVEDEIIPLPMAQIGAKQMMKQITTFLHQELNSKHTADQYCR